MDSGATERVDPETNVRAADDVHVNDVAKITDGLPPFDHAPSRHRSRLVFVSAAVVVPSVGAVAPGVPDVIGTVVQVFAVVVERTFVEAVTVQPVAALAL